MGKARVPSRVQSPFLNDEASPMEGGAAWKPQSRGSPAPAPALTASERAYMIRKAKEASVALVDHAHTLDGPVQWHYTGKFRGIQMYRGEGSFENASTAGTEFLCGVTTMLGSIEEVAWHFDQQTTEQMRNKKAEDVLDCAVLYSLVQGDSPNPFYRVSAKYQSYEGPSAFSRPRDYCYLECQDTFRHASGRRGWVLSMHSIKLPSCPDVEGVVRGSMYHSGYVFVEAEKEGYMDVMHSLQINFKSTSRLPHFLLNSALKRRILSVVTISREIQSARLGHQTLLQKKDLMPKRARALCVICSRKFSLFVRKTRCRMCGEVACQPCAPQVEITAPGQPPRKTRICVKCYNSSPSDEFEDVAKLREDPTGARRQQNETRYSDILQEQGETFIELDEDEQDADEDGLEEQSSCSVFAQSRFTQASRESVVTASPFDIDEEVNMDERLSDGSSAYWKESSDASSMLGWNQASSVKHVDGIYDPQASNSNLFGASNYSMEERRNNSTAPIPEDVPPVNTTNKTLSIQEIAKARSARYGIVSRFPPPPPPSPPHEVIVNASLDAGALKAHNMRYSKSQAAKNKSITSSRKMFTPSMEELDENESPNIANAVPKVPRKKPVNVAAAVAKTEEGTRVSRIESGAFGTTRSSAILNQVRINRSRTIQFTPEGDYRSSAMLKAIEEEHLNRMREIERMQALARQQAARRSMASNGSRRSSQFKVQPTKSSVGSERDAVEAADVAVAKPRRSSPRRSSPRSPPGSPPGTPPRVQARAPPRTPPHSPPRRSSVMSKQRTSRGIGDRPRRTETINEERPSNSPRQIQFLSTRSNDAFSDVRASVPPSDHLEDLAFNTQRSGFHVSAGPVAPEDLSFEQPRPDTPPHVSPPPSEPSENLGFDASQISILARSKLSSSIAILEAPADAARKSAVVMMERPSTPRESTASMMFDEDLVNRPTEDLYEQIHANRARKAQQLPEEDFRSSEAMRTMESEHRKRMEELNRIAVDQIGARISRLDDLRDSSTDSEDLEYRPLGRSKRSGTILFTPEIIERSTEVMETMEGEHKSRMEELNQLAFDHTGDRISKLVADDEDIPFGDFQPHNSRLVDGEGGSAVDEFYADSSRIIPGSESSSVDRVQADTSGDSDMARRASRNTSEFEQENLEFIPCIDEEHTTDEYYPAKEQNSNSTSSTEASERVSTPRESCVSAFDEDLMNRPTNDIFEQVRANRNGKHVPVYTTESTDDVRSSEMMQSIEASHKQRMEELNRIAVDHLGNRISSLDDVSVSAYRPVRELYDNEEEEMQWRSTDIMEQYENDHEQEMETLRRKIHQLEEECRESIASVLTPEEMDLSDLSDEPPAPSPKIKSKKTKSLERNSSYKSSKIIRTTHLNHLPPQFAEPVSPQVLYEQIAQLTKLQRQMALAKDDADEEEFRARIKAQYRLLRSIQVQNRR